jgi:hypothetical protein
MFHQRKVVKLVLSVLPCPWTRDSPREMLIGFSWNLMPSRITNFFSLQSRFLFSKSSRNENFTGISESVSRVTLKFSEISGRTYPTAQRNITDDLKLCHYHCENIKCVNSETHSYFNTHNFVHVSLVRRVACPLQYAITKSSKYQYILWNF